MARPGSRSGDRSQNPDRDTFLEAPDGEYALLGVGKALTDFGIQPLREYDLASSRLGLEALQR